MGQLFVAFLVCLLSAATDDREAPADAAQLRSLREQLGESTLTRTGEALREMQAAPHSKHGALIFEALVRAVRRVEEHRARSAELKGELDELKAQVAAAQKSTSPSQMKRLDEQKQAMENEIAERRAHLLIEQGLEAMLRQSLKPIALALPEVARGNLGRDLVDHLESHRRLDERCALLDLIGQVETSSSIFALMVEVRDRNSAAECKVRALEGLGNLKATSALPAMVAALQDDDWRVQAEAVESIRKVHQRSSIPMLIGLLQSVNGRLRDDVGFALRSLTGQKLAADQATWQRWWTDHQGDFVMPDQPVADPVAASEESGGAHFYGISTFSLGVIFVLDVSTSMKEPAQEGTRVRRKIDVARDQLKSAVLSLSSEARFNVFLYAGDVEPAFPEPVLATDDHRRQAIAFVEKREPGGRTNIHAALTRAFAGAERSGTKAGGRHWIDTLFFLSDGKATDGLIQRSDLLLEEVHDYNQDLRLKIHSVGVGQHDVDFLRTLAQQNRGLYVAR